MAINHNKAVLLDFDGVILRNNPVNAVVRNRCERYVAKHIPILSPDKLKQLNSELYDVYGHTTLGLQALGHKRATMRDFNNYVYKNINYLEFANTPMTHKNDIDQLKHMRAICKQNRIPLYIFSNAPSEWCKNVLEHMSRDFLDIPLLDHVTSVTPKPHVIAYEGVEAYLPNHTSLVFVDDKLINFKTIQHNPKWQKFLLTSANQESPITLHTSNEVAATDRSSTNHMVMVNSLDMVTRFLVANAANANVANVN